MRLCGAHDWNRTNDLLLTKEVLYRLSYVSTSNAFTHPCTAGSQIGHPRPIFQNQRPVAQSMERETGIEPALVAWKATVLPLNYSRPDYFRNRDAALSNYLRRFHSLKVHSKKPGGGRWIRTTEGMSQQIYSLPPLAAWVSLHGAAYFQAPKAPLSRTVLPDQAECPPVQARCAASR